MSSPSSADLRRAGTPSAAAPQWDFAGAGKTLPAPGPPRRSFATLLGEVKKEASPEAPRSPAGPPPRPPGPGATWPHPRPAEKARSHPQPRPAALDSRARQLPEEPQDPATVIASPEEPADAEPADPEPLVKPSAEPGCEPWTAGAVAPLLPPSEIPPVLTFSGGVAPVLLGAAATEASPEPGAEVAAAGREEPAAGYGGPADLAQPPRMGAGPSGSPASARSPQALGTAAPADAEERAGATAAPLPAAAPLAGPTRAEKNAAGPVPVALSPGERDVSKFFDQSEKRDSEAFKKSDFGVGALIAKADSAMLGTLSNLSDVNRTPPPTADVVTRGSATQVAEDVAAIAEKMRLAGSHRCVLDFDVAGQGRLRVEVVRRDDQLKAVFSTESDALRASLQAAFDRADGPRPMAASVEWQGASPEGSGGGRGGAQADAESRQKTAFHAPSDARPTRLSAPPAVSTETAAAPPVATLHRLHLFA